MKDHAWRMVKPQLGSTTASSASYQSMRQKKKNVRFPLAQIFAENSMPHKVPRVAAVPPLSSLRCCTHCVVQSTERAHSSISAARLASLCEKKTRGMGRRSLIRSLAQIGGGDCMGIHLLVKPPQTAVSTIRVHTEH